MITESVWIANDSGKGCKSVILYKSIFTKDDALDMRSYPGTYIYIYIYIYIVTATLQKKAKNTLERV